MKRIFVLISGALALALSDLGARTWTEEGSGRTLEGDFLKVVDGKAWIRRANGAVLQIDLTRLSEEDRKFIEEAKAEPPGGDKPDANNKYEWLTDFKDASKRAREQNKAMLLDFTGSDWCGWCIRLKKEVFDEKEFQEYAKENLILVELDFPRTKELPGKVKEQNEQLSQEYGIQGFPTIVLLDSRGKLVGKTGYKEGGPQKYVEHLKELLKDS
ncbi:MAG TPA: thioredoxin family protein [Verrucomicrobiales bacterium]|nr:thioredoxin family protein [Verrucomicrobiales bacterium]